MSEPIKPRTVLAVVAAWSELDPELADEIRSLSPVLAKQLARLTRELRSGRPLIRGDDPNLNIEAERRATYLSYPLSDSHRHRAPWDVDDAESL